MAEKLEFKVGVDNKLMSNAMKLNVKTTKLIVNELKKVGTAAKQAKKDLSEVEKTGFEKTTKSATLNSVDLGKGFFGKIIAAFKRLSIIVRSTHMHGVDPLTNKFARLFNVIGGAGITSITLFTTAIMAAYFGLKKVNDYIQNYYRGLAAGFDNIIKISKARLEALNKEHQGTQKIVDELKEINDKEKIGNALQAYADMLAKRLVSTWEKLGGKVDEAVKKLKDFREVQAEIDYATIEKQSNEIKAGMKARANKLNIMLTQYIGENSIWAKANPFSLDRWKMKNAFSKDEFQDLSVLQMFPGWMHNWKDLNEVAKIDTRKFMFGDYSQKLEFLQLVASQLTDEDKQRELSLIINEVKNQIADEDLLKSILDPVNKAKERAREIDDTTKKLNTLFSKFSKAVELLKQGTEKFNVSLMSDQLKLDYWKKKKEESSKIMAENDNKIADILDNVDWSKVIKDEKTGEWSTTFEKDLIAKNGMAESYFLNFKNAREKYADEYQGLLNDYAKYKISQQAIKDLDKAISETPYSNTLRIKSLKEQRTIELSAVKLFESTIDQRWAQYNQHVDSYAEENLRKTNQAMNDPQLLKGIKDQRDYVNKIVRALALASVVVDQSTESLDNLREASSQYLITLEKLANAEDDWITELTNDVREYVAKLKDVKNKKGYLTGFGNSYIEWYMKQTGQGQSLRLQQILQLLKAQLGNSASEADLKRIAKRAAYIEKLQNDYLNPLSDLFSSRRYVVKSNALAARGGWNSSIYVSGKDNIPQQQLKTNQNILLINKQQKELLNDLNKVANKMQQSLEI